MIFLTIIFLNGATIKMPMQSHDMCMEVAYSIIKDAKYVMCGE